MGRTWAIPPEIAADLVKAADAASVAGGALFASLLAAVGVTAPVGPADRYAFATLLAAALFVAVVGRGGFYTITRLADRRSQFRFVALAWGGTLAVLLGFGFLTKSTGDFSRAWMLVWAASTLVALLALRAAVAWRIGLWTREGRFRRRAAIVGPRAAGLAARLEGDPGYRIAGLFDDGASRAGLGTLADLLALARAAPIDEVILAVPPDDGPQLARLVARLRELPVDLRLALPGLAPVLAAGTGVRVPMLNLVERPLKRWKAVTKRAEDMAIGALLLMTTAPLMALIALAVLATSGRPVLFVQDRFGFNNKPIRVLKFRTMRQGTDPSGARPTIPGDGRVTRLGRFLRAWSLDELPQLFNVLAGDMSLVGPRPHAVAMQVDGCPYEDVAGGYFRRHRVRPGMTGLAQVEGLRGELAGAEDARLRLDADLDYIEHWSLGLDFSILMRTVRAVLVRRNAY